MVLLPFFPILMGNSSIRGALIRESICYHWRTDPVAPQVRADRFLRAARAVFGGIHPERHSEVFLARPRRA
jgi:hypothetical protein